MACGSYYQETRSDCFGEAEVFSAEGWRVGGEWDWELEGGVVAGAEAGYWVDSGAEGEGCWWGWGGGVSLRMRFWMGRGGELVFGHVEHTLCIACWVDVLDLRCRNSRASLWGIWMSWLS